MSWSRGFVYWGLALVLGAWLSNAVIDPASVVDDSVVKEGPILSLVAERVDRVLIESEGLKLVIVRDADSRWAVREPAGTEVPADIVDAVVETLSTVSVIEAVSEDADGAEQFGLNPPELRLRLEVAGTVVGDITLGRPNPTRTAVYARRSGQGRVFLLGLNAKYYLDLIRESVHRQLRNAAADAEATDPEATDAEGTDAEGTASEDVVTAPSGTDEGSDKVGDGTTSDPDVDPDLDPDSPTTP
jgi:hypothetical protein